MEKSIILKSIVVNIRERNGRFLKNEAGSWVEVGNRRAIEKQATQGRIEWTDERYRQREWSWNFEITTNWILNVTT